MPTTAIVCGILMTLIGIAGYFYGVMNGNASLTALIPALFGTALEGLGLVARAKEDLRKHLMHAAVVVALLGFILTAGRILMKLGEMTMSAAVLSQLATAIVCLVFVILAVRSFIAARRSD
jgi:low temperature requirement protein LtrA